MFYCLYKFLTHIPSKVEVHHFIRKLCHWGYTQNAVINIIIKRHLIIGKVDYKQKKRNW